MIKNKIPAITIIRTIIAPRYSTFLFRGIHPVAVQINRDEKSKRPLGRPAALKAITSSSLIVPVTDPARKSNQFIFSLEEFKAVIDDVETNSLNLISSEQKQTQIP